MNEFIAQPANIQKWNRLQRRSNKRWLVNGLLPYPGVIGMSGHPKTGKTFCGLGLSAHIASGTAYRGREVTKGAVVYVMAEGGEAAQDRKEAIRIDMFGGEDVDLPIYLITTPVDINNDHQTVIQIIGQELGDVMPVAVFVDTLNATLFGSENNDEDMSGYMRGLHAIKAAFNCSVIVVHHLAKKESSGGRGHGSFLGALDTLLVIKETATGNFTLTVSMMKDGAKGAILTNRLKTVIIGQDDEGEDITSCVVVDPNPGGGVALTSKSRASQALAVLVELVEKQGKQPPKGLAFPKGTRVVTEQMWRVACKARKIGEPNSEDTAKTARLRARNALFKRGLVVRVDEYVYVAPDKE
tara:strand:- start:12 stop:1076 length:1065 start_codon:yes stop_codon:yes gene_type:complete